MIDNAAWVSKIVMGFVAVWLVYTSVREDKANRFAQGVTLFLLALFLTGVEMSIGVDEPWAYLILTGTEQEWSKAFFGGVMMLMIPEILLVVGGKELANLLENKS